MTLQFWYWLFMALWLVFGVWSAWPFSASTARPLGASLLIFILFLILGWQTFGSPIKS